MIEQPPRPEGGEFSEEERALIEMIQANLPGTREKFLAWCQQEELDVEKVTEYNENALAKIKWQIKKGKILMEGNRPDEAWMEFRSAQWAANSMGESGSDLHAEVSSLVQYMVDQDYKPVDDPSEKN